MKRYCALAPANEIGKNPKRLEALIVLRFQPGRLRRIRIKRKVVDELLQRLQLAQTSSTSPHVNDVQWVFVQKPTERAPIPSKPVEIVRKCAAIERNVTQ
jgi:hypothetical protein